MALKANKLLFGSVAAFLIVFGVGQFRLLEARIHRRRIFGIMNFPEKLDILPFLCYTECKKGGEDMKKKIIICAFLLLILATVIYTVVSAVISYQYDMDPANGVDILKGFDAVLIIMVGGFVAFYELDLFYTVYYFFIKPKTAVKSILNILANLSLLSIFFSRYYGHIFEEDAIAPLLIFCIYSVLRIVYFIISTRNFFQEQ